MTTLYIDMDDVVADFSSKALEIAGYLMPDGGNQKYPPDVWEKFLYRPRLYSELSVCHGADLVVDACKEISAIKGWSILFLTAVPRDNDFPWAFNDKVNWANTHYPGIPVWFGPYSRDKHLRCTPGDILIDDRMANIDTWNSAGGVGIHHVTAEQTVYKLKRL